MIFELPSSHFLTGTQGVDWNYSKTVMPNRIFLQPSLKAPETPVTLEKPELETGYYQEDHYELSGSVRPYLPSKITKKLEKWAKQPLDDKEALKVMKDVAEIAINFYNVHEDKYLAIAFNGRIVESANSSFDLLMKLQGRELPYETFVWHVGSDVFTGWGN